MKRALASFFLVIILLNVGGYYLVFEGWKYHVSVTWVLNEDAPNLPELIIQIPMHNPEGDQNRNWEKASGQFEYLGETYRITERKLTQEAVYLACVKDNEISHINQQLEDFAQGFADKPVDAKQTIKSFPGFVKEYVTSVITVKPGVVGWLSEIVLNPHSNSLSPTFAASIIHPPERIA